MPALKRHLGSVRSIRAGACCATTLAFSLIVVATASANPVKSLYTTIELKGCKPVKQPAQEKAWVCPGLARYPVLIAEHHAHHFVSFGENANKHRAASQTLPEPNTIFGDGKRRPTIEWRFVRRGAGEVPYAAIVSYFVGPEPRRTRVLVVARVDEGQSCHVAYVDAAHPDAIVVARGIADEEARKFDCRQEPRRIGAEAAN